MANHTIDCDVCGEDLRGYSTGHDIRCPAKYTKYRILSIDAKIRIYNDPTVLPEEICKYFLSNTDPERDQNGLTLEHAAWMLENLPDNPLTRQRWIGYIQCILIVNQLVSLDDLRDLTRPIAV